MLAVLFVIPAILADENQELWNKSTFVQSAKIQYQHVYSRTHARSDLQHAIDLIDQAIAKFGRDPELYFIQGTFYAEVNALDTMIMYFDSVKTFCDDETIDEKLRKNCYKKEKYIEKIAKFRQKYWEDSYNDGVEMLRQYDTTRAWMERSTNPDSVKIIDSLSQLTYKKAKENFGLAIKMMPDSSITYDAIGILEENAGNQMAAAEGYKKAMEYRGLDAAGASRVAYMYIQMPESENKEAKWDSSIVWFEKYLEFKKDDVNALINLSVAYSVNGDLEKSHEYTMKVLEVDPENIQALTSAGQYYFSHMQDAALAIQDIPDDDANAESRKKELEAEAEEYRKKAEEAFSTAVNVDPQNGDAWRLLGIMRLLSGNSADAATAFEKYLEINPTDLSVLDYLGRAYIQVPDYEKAIVAYEKVVEIDRGNEDAWERLSELYSTVGRTVDADKAKAKYEELKKL